MMLRKRYQKAIRELFDYIDETQSERITQAAGLIVECVTQGNHVHIFDTGHIIDSEIINRAGGLALLKPLKYQFTVTDPVRITETNKEVPNVEGIGRLVIEHSNAKAGDCLILGSVSGKSPNIIDIGLAAKQASLKVISVTSLTYSKAVPPMHSSGKKLYDIGDVVIDNCAPKGDAMLEVKGAEHPFAPASGLSAAYILWCVCADVIEKLIEGGYDPTIFKSVNFPDGRIEYERLVKKYENSGL